MKRNKSPDGYRNKILQVRLTEVENAAFQILYEKAKINNEGLLVSDFIRQQLLYESNDKRLKEIFNEIRKIRTEFHQSLVALRCLEDNASKEYFNEVITGIENKIDTLKNEMEMMSNGNNDFKEH
jgi:transcription termination factor NusB